MKKTSYLLLVFTVLFLASCSKESDCFNNAQDGNAEASGAIIEISPNNNGDYQPASGSIDSDDPDEDDGIRDGDSNDDDDDLEDKRKKSKG